MTVLASLAALAPAVGANTAPPHDYHVLGPEPLSGTHKYFVLSPAGTAQVTVRIGASTVNLTANQES